MDARDREFAQAGEIVPGFSARDFARSQWKKQGWWIAIDLYALTIGLYLAARGMTGHSLWPVALLSYVAHYLLLPAFVTLPLALWRRRWLSAAVSAFGVAMFVVWFGELFRSTDMPSAAAPDLRVMSANVHGKPHRLRN